MKFVKELFTAYYDPNTNKIMNCKKGGLVYFHELRHQKQKIINLPLTYLVLLGSIGHLLAVVWWMQGDIIALYLPFVSWFPFTLLYLSSEVDAWTYAFYKVLGGGKMIKGILLFPMYILLGIILKLLLWSGNEPSR